MLGAGFAAACSDFRRISGLEGAEPAPPLLPQAKPFAFLKRGHESAGRCSWTRSGHGTEQANLPGGWGTRWLGAIAPIQRAHARPPRFFAV